MTEGKYLYLLRKAARFGGEVYLIKLIELNILVAVAVVAAETLQQRGQHSASHNGAVFTQRILYNGAAAQPMLRRHIHLVIIAGADKRVGQNFVEAHTAAQSADAALSLLLGVKTAFGGGALKTVDSITS